MSDVPDPKAPSMPEPSSGPEPDSPPGPAGEPAAANKAGSWGAALLTTFTTVFLAELGDKTQLAALLLAAQSGRPTIVFVGASLALISSSLVGVLLGRWLAKVLPPQQLERLAGLLMVGLGLWLGRQAVLNLAPLPDGLPLG
jgi:putative Ca2+/H+ antiporter (TMEM165/GDT1 family)